MRALISGLKRLRRRLLDRRKPLSGEPTVRHQVNIEYWHEPGCPNLGDLLSPVVVGWMLRKEGIARDRATSKTRHLYAIGSVLGNAYRRLNATVWGSGVQDAAAIGRLCRSAHAVRLDVRAVRGPITRQLLHTAGYACPEVYGDPAVLLPLIYRPTPCREKIPVLLIHHWEQADQPGSLPVLDIRTGDYQGFIDSLSRAEKVVSSSLHGIILAEAYGIPAVFLHEGMLQGFQLLKVYDWYYATGRMSVPIAASVEEAMTLVPLPIPDLRRMQEELVAAFPYDLWE